MKLPLKLLTILGATPAQLYDARVLATSPLRYNKLNEASGTAIIDSSGNGYTGTYTGVDLANVDSPFLPDEAPLWDGTNDYGDLYSAAFASALSLDEITIMIWFKMSALGVWSDAAIRFMALFLRDSSNQIHIQKTATANQLRFRRIANGTSSNSLITVAADTGWVCVAISASVAGGGLLSAGDMRAYRNGVQIGTTQTGNVPTVGTGLSTTGTVLGAGSTTPTTVHSGWLSRLIIWNRPIDAAILALMTP